MMTTLTWSLCSDLDGVGTAMITSRVMSVPSSAHPRRVANPSRSPRQADFADPLPCHPRDARLTVPDIIADGSRITALRHAELPAQRECGAQSGRSYVRSSGAGPETRPTGFP